MFQIKGNSNCKWTQHFNQSYEKRTSTFAALIPVFGDGFFHLIFKLFEKQSLAQFCALPVILTLFVTVVLICSIISWLVKVTSPSHGKLCKVRVHWYKLDSARWLNIGEFYLSHNVLLFDCLNFDLFYQYGLYYTQDSKIHKLHGILNNLEFCTLYCNISSF